MATWEWMSMVVLFGRTSRPGLPCLRAAVASYLLHCVAISASFLLSARGWFAALYFFDRIILSEKSATFRDDALEHAEVLGDNGIVELDATGGAAKHHPAGIDDDHVVGEVERQLDILLDQYDRLSFGLELRDGASDLGHQLRREPFGRLVHQQHAGVAHERAPDREHLLLAAGQRAGDLS